jgi:hypothetical protein
MLAMTGFDPDLMTGAYQSNAGKPLAPYEAVKATAQYYRKNESSVIEGKLSPQSAVTSIDHLSGYSS